MGAGISGLACAFELEKHGISPDIYENRSQVGDRFVNGEIFLEILNRPIIDCMKYLAQEYQLYLKPINNIKELVMFSENQRTVLHGHLGYVDIRGRHPQALEVRMAQLIKSPIQFNSTKTYEELVSEYSHVVMAVGDGMVAKNLQPYKIDLTVTLKGATITGNFDPRVVHAWLNNDYAPGGYAYLIPFNQQEANIVIAYPDYRGKEDPDIYWNRFVQDVKNRFEMEFRITDEFFISGYAIGLVKDGRIGNTFFTGNCFGSIMPFLGFGQFAAILTGIYAAEDLAGISNYKEKTQILRDSYQNSLALRKQLEMLSNHDYDTLVKLIDTKAAKYIIEEANVDILKYLGTLIKPYISLKSKI